MGVPPTLRTSPTRGKSPHRRTAFKPSLTEFAVLGLLAEGPTHGFTIWKELDWGTPLGRVLAVRRPLVYRALERLTEAGLAEPTLRQSSSAGPDRVIRRITSSGKRLLNSWLDEPVTHLRDLRLEFQLKLAIHQRGGRSPIQLISEQRNALESTLEALDPPGPGPTDHLDLWRRLNARMVRSYLDQLEEFWQQRA